MYNGYDLNNNPTVLALGNFDFTGDVIPASWFDFIVNNDGRPQMNAIFVLGRLVYWYRPIRAHDLETQRPLPWRKKFADDLYRLDYGEMAQFLKISERQVRDAVTTLRQRGLVHIHLRYEESASGTKGTRVYIELIVPQIQGISSRPDGEYPDDLSNPIPGQVARYGWGAQLSPFNARKNQPPLYSRKNVSSYSRKNVRLIGTEIPKTKNPNTTRIPLTPLPDTPSGMDGFVVGSSVGDFSTVGSLALQPTFEQLPFDSLTTTEPMGVSGNGELEPSPSTAPRNSVVRSIFEQQSSTVLPQPVQDLIQWTVQEINATVTKREIEEMKVLCEGNYSLDELKACYLSQRIESTSWKKQSWITVKYGISQFAAQYRTIIEAVEKLPTLPALITALGCDWEKLCWADRFIWVAAIKKHEWDLTKAEVFLAYFKQTPKGKKGFAPTVADLRDHWETALEAEATLTETQQSLVSQLDAKGLHHAQSIRLVVADENEVRLQLAALPYRDMGGIESVSGWLITAIRNRYAIPEAIVKLQKRASDRVAVKEREEAELAAQEALWKAHGATYGEYLRRCERLIAERHPAEWTEFQVLHPDGQGDQYETYLWRFSRSGKSSLEVLFFTQWLEMFEAGKDPVQSCLKIVPLALDTLPVKTVTTDSSAVDRRAQQAQEMRDYREYLAACEVEIQRSHPDLYQQFLAKSQKDRDLIKSFPRMLTAFEEPEGHWQRFVQFFGRVAVVVQVQSCNTWAENKGN